jgi:tetratricopeptide (TPR) repeat protein
MGTVMFRSWRLQLREAEEAFRAGRLDEAVSLVRQGDLHRYLPGKKLSVAIAEQLAGRAGRRLRQGESAEGWQDLDVACRLSSRAEAVMAIRREILDGLLAEAERCLAVGETAKAIKELEAIERHTGTNDTAWTLFEVARRMESARNLRRRGKHADALIQLERAAALRPELELVRDQRESCQREADEAASLSQRLHAAMLRSDWTETLVLAGRLLELSPQSTMAADARRRAWLAVGGPERENKPLDATMTWHSGGSTGLRQHALGNDPARDEGGSPERFLLWVDGVGGFLVCLDDEIVLGQNHPGNRLAVPIQGDLSRQHARIRREDGYLIEPLGEVWVEGRKIGRTTVLSDNDEIRLGSSVCLRFRQPHVLSSTARLELVSRHRTQPSADAVLLMAESCVLGPKWQNHVVCRDWANDVVLYRRDGVLYCRTTGGIEVDGRFCDEQTPVQRDSHVVGSDFSMTLEPVA